jgi:hypothetical protein
MRVELQTHEDFKQVKTIIEEKIESKGHMCIFLPKFHCELNPIERAWCLAKKKVGAYNNGTITRLRKLVPESLDEASADMIRKFCDTVRAYEDAYRQGHNALTIETAVKRYKSHRRVF